MFSETSGLTRATHYNTPEDIRHLQILVMSSGMLCRVALVRTEVSEEGSVSITRVIRIRRLGMTLAVTGNRNMLRRNAMSL
jgi:hypothetical protein